MAPQNNQMTAQQAQQQNLIARQMIASQAINMTQQIYTNTFNPANGNVVNIQPRYVGLIKGFWVKVALSVTNAAGSTATLTGLGAANALSVIQFNDLNNNVRINTSGWHLHFINTVRQGYPFCATDALNTYPVAYGNTFNTNISAPATIAASGTGTINMWYWVPLAYSNVDLRGAIFANVVNATMNLQLTVNPNPFVASGDATTAIYSGNAGSITSATITVYQNYYDQLPTIQGNNGASILLPILDMQTMYELKNTNITGITANQDFPIAYSNFRDFLSTVAIFDNGGTLSAGTDINYWALQTANYTNIFKCEPKLVTNWTRQRITEDFPAGMYYFDHRDKPISTVQYGNMELILNASTVNTNAVCLMGYEDFALTNVIAGAQSLAPA